MKRKGNLYESIISIENLTLADHNAQKGKSKQRGVIRHNRNREENIWKLYESLKNKTYKTSKYSIIVIREPKERKISRLEYYPNRIVHHAIMIKLEDIFVECFIAQSYSCIKKRGIHKCLKGITKALKDEVNTRYCLKLDVKKFFPSVNKDILKRMIRTKIKDKDLLWLLDEIIDSNDEGLPLGNYLSQWFGNFYLNGFDHYIKQKKIKYFRYCDDMVIFHSSKEFLHALRKEIQKYLSSILDLELSNYQVFPVAIRGVDIVGYKIYPQYIFIRKSIKQRYKRMLRTNRNEKSIASYNGWLNHANCKHLKKRYSSNKTISI